MSRDWIDLTWSEKTWGERGQTVLCWIIACAICLGMCIGGLLVLGSMMDGADRYNSEHRRCLKHATNGLEIERCR